MPTKIKIFYTEKGYYPSANNCVSPSDDEICLTSSAGNVLSYAPISPSAPSSYKLTLSNGVDQYSTNQGDISCPKNFILVPGSSTYGTTDFCIMKYEAKQLSATVPVSKASGLPWTGVTQANAVAYSQNVEGCQNVQLVSEAQWMTLAQNVLSVASNWSGGVVGTGAINIGHTDSIPANALEASIDSDGYSGTGQASGTQKRTLTLTNGEVIWDISGNVHEYTNSSVQTPVVQPGVAGGGFAWRRFSAVTTAGSLPVSVLPSSTGISGSSSWSSTNNVGMLYSSSDNAYIKIF